MSFKAKGFKVRPKGRKWFSTSRILNGTSRKDTGRNPNFNAEETKLLISLWGDPSIQKMLFITQRKYSVIAQLADKMIENGYNRTADEINTRLINLKSFYTRMKKDIELGICDKTTWEHFEAIDKIVNQEMFIAQPNEMPKSCSKNKLAIEQNDKESKNSNKRKCLDKTSLPSSKPNDENSDERKYNSIEDTVNLVKIEDEEYLKLNETFEKDTLLIHKPLNDDIELQDTFNEIINTESATPRLPEFIQLSNNNSMAVSSTCRTLTAGRVNSSLQTTSSPTILVANQSNTAPSTGKISLVPTNFLLHQNTGQPQHIQIRQQAQPRIICTQPNLQTNNTMVTPTGAGRMKVLLVNAFQNGQQSKNIPAAIDSATPSIITPSHLHQNTTQDFMASKKIAETYSRMEETTNNKDIDTEMLFNQLIVMQTENNEIQNQRLEIERQRLEFERSIGDKLLTALLSLSQAPKPDLAQNINTEKIITETGKPPDLIDESGFQLLIPKIEKMD